MKIKRIEWAGYNYKTFDGYGRYSTYLIKALDKLGIDVHPVFSESVNAPDFIKEQMGIEKGSFTISCLPVCYLQNAPSGGRHWLLTMTEGSEAPDGWCDIINKRNIERVIVPCEYNAIAFRNGGVKVPIHVIPGGTDPYEFSVNSQQKIREGSEYTFLALGDRGFRKGWMEAYQAFYKAFGNPSDTPNVKLIIKARPNSNDLLEAIAKAQNPDPRLTVMIEDVDDMRDVYNLADCFVIPSRSEGWGMPHREAVMMGIPVITQQYSGLDDGYTKEWAIVVDGGKLEKIPSHFENIKGEWLKADVNEVAKAMRWCYENPEQARFKAMLGSLFLKHCQTWDHSAVKLLNLIEEYN